MNHNRGPLLKETRVWEGWIKSSNPSEKNRNAHLVHDLVSAKRNFLGLSRSFPLAFFALLIAIFFIPHEGSLRPLTDPKELAAFGVDHLSLAARPVSKRMDFQGLISENYVGIPIDDTLISTSKVSPYFPKPQRVGLTMATYARRNECTLQLEVAGQMSESVQCRDMVDNSIQVFKFKNIVSPGVYTFTLHWQGYEGQNVALYSYEKDGKLWALIHGQNTGLSMARVFWRWLKQEPIKAGGYLTLLCFSVIAVCFWSKIAVSVTFLSVFLGLGIIWKPYSGHDETAHIDMLHQAMTQGTTKSRELFFNDVYREMIGADFYRLHHAAPPQLNACPHSLLASCGVSDGPKNLYQFYSDAVRQMNRFIPTEFFDHPRRLRRMAMGIHFGLLVAVLSVIFLMGGYLWLEIMMTQMIFNGAMIAIFPAVTNDVPIMLLGVLISFVFQWIWVENLPRSKSCGIFLALFGVVFLIRKIDPGMISGMALIPFAVLFLTRPKKEYIKSLNESGEKSLLQRALLEKIAWPFAGVIVLISVVAGIRLFLMLLPASMDFLITHVDPRFSNLSNVIKFDGFFTTLNLFYIYWKSVLGTYIWGHSYLHEPVYAVGLLMLGVMFANGFAAVILEYDKRWQRVFACLLLSAGLSAFVLSVMAAFFGGIYDIQIVRDSFLKSRFTTLGLATVWIVIGIGLFKMQENLRCKKALSTITGIWGVVLLVYYFPRFFILDIY